MSPRTALALLFAIAALAIGAAACNGGQPIDLGDPGAGGAVYDGTFQAGAFLAIEDENCGTGDSCHSSTGQGGAGGLQLPPGMTPTLAYSEIGAELVIDTSNAAASSLLTKGAGAGHGGGAQWSSGDDTYQSVLAWITSGAQFN